MPGTTTRSRSAIAAPKSSGSCGGAAGSAARTSPGRVLRHHRAVGQALVVVGQPVDEPVAVAAEFFGRHGGSHPCGVAACIKARRAGVESANERAPKPVRPRLAPEGPGRGPRAGRVCSPSSAKASRLQSQPGPPPRWSMLRQGRLARLSQPRRAAQELAQLRPPRAARTETRHPPTTTRATTSTSGHSA